MSGSLHKIFSYKGKALIPKELLVIPDNNNLYEDGMEVDYFTTKENSERYYIITTTKEKEPYLSSVFSMLGRIKSRRIQWNHIIIEIINYE
jgi:hypothetical protein